MKRIIPFIIVLSLVTAAAVSYKDSKDFRKKKYETALKARFGHLLTNKTEGESKAADMPDMAAIQDFYQTVDPATGTVPRERLLQVYQQSGQAGIMKPTVDDPQWTGTTVEMGGRTRAIMYDPNVPDKVWAGGVTGGLWFNNNISESLSPWVSVGDFWSCLSIRCITYDPNNHQIFYIGTGEPETALQTYRESSGLGNGIWKSTDGGQTWNVLPSTSQFAYITKIVVRNEGGNSVVYAGVVSGVYHGVHQSLPSDGLFRSTDGGATWTQVLPDISGTTTPYSPADVVLGADGRIFVGSRPNLEDKGGATILFSDSGLPGSWAVDDHYKTIIEADPDYPIPGRVVLATAPSDANRVYALVSSGFINPVNNFKYFYCLHIAKSTDKGATWTDTNLPNDLTSGFSFATIAWHALDAAVDPNNPDNIWIGGLDVHKSTNGGASWHRVSDWSLMYYGGGPQYIHADQHIMLFKPGSSTEMVFGCDGGVFYTSTATQTNPSCEEHNIDYNTLQFYSADIKNEPGSLTLMGGLQDNGSELYEEGTPMSIMTMVSGGDGAYAFFDHDTPSLSMSSLYYNVWYIYVNNMFYNYLDSWESGVFVNPTDYDDANNTLYSNACDFINTNLDYYCRIWDIDAGVSGTFKKANSSATSYFSAVRLSPYSPPGTATLFLGTQSGQLFRVVNAESTPVTTEITGDDFPVGNISSIDIGNSAGDILVTFSNYGVVSVWHTIDGGVTWKNKEGALPDMPVRWGMFHPNNSRQVMLATEAGIYITYNFDQDNVTWTKSSAGMPNVRVDMLNMRDDFTFVAATHGRGLFTAVWDPVTGVKERDAAAFSIYPNPANDVVNISCSNTGTISWKVYDQSGKTLLNGNGASSGSKITMAGLPAGVYYVSVYAGGKSLGSQKIVKTGN